MDNRLTTLQEVLGEWNGYVLLIHHQLDNRTVWRVGWMKRLLLFDLHFGTIRSPYTCILAFLVEKIFEVTPTIVPRPVARIGLHAE